MIQSYMDSYMDCDSIILGLSSPRDPIWLCKLATIDVPVGNLFIWTQRFISLYVINNSALIYYTATIHTSCIIRRTGHYPRSAPYKL